VLFGPQTFKICTTQQAAFCEKVKVYHDPFAKETTGLAVGGITVAGGNDKSYYVLIDGSKAAFRLYKKDYKKEFAGLWQKCPAVVKKNPNPTWGDLTKHIVEFTNCGK
jgi:hypothetical protein